MFGAKALIFFVFDDGTALFIESHIEDTIFWTRLCDKMCQYFWHPTNGSNKSNSRRKKIYSKKIRHSAIFFLSKIDHSARNFYLCFSLPRSIYIYVCEWVCSFMFADGASRLSWICVRSMNITIHFGANIRTNKLTKFCFRPYSNGQLITYARYNLIRN